jgi:hypothetical protein
MASEIQGENRKTFKASFHAESLVSSAPAPGAMCHDDRRYPTHVSLFLRKKERRRKPGTVRDHVGLGA